MLIANFRRVAAIDRAVPFAIGYRRSVDALSATQGRDCHGNLATMAKCLGVAKFTGPGILALRYPLWWTGRIDYARCLVDHRPRLRAVVAQTLGVKFVSVFIDHHIKSPLEPGQVLLNLHLGKVHWLLLLDAILFHLLKKCLAARLHFE